MISPSSDIEKGVSVSTSVIVTETKLVSAAIEEVKLLVWSEKDPVGKALPNMFIKIIPEPILSYWSL